jgi:hypothetical protein
MKAKMSNQRYDIEWALAPAVAAYLGGKISPDIQSVSPVITFFDPMAVDEANRIIVEIPQAKTMKEARGNFSGTCKVTVKSRWAKPTVKTDFSAHFDRTNWTRDALMSPTLATDVQAAALVLATAAGQGSTGFNFDFQQPEISFQTDVREGWIYSEASFGFNGYFSP